MTKKYMSILLMFVFIPVIIYSQSLEITYPNGGESLSAGDSVTIQWTTSGQTPVPLVDLSYSLDNGSSWEIIEGDITNEDSFKWEIPLFPEDYEQCLVKVYDSEDGAPFDQSDGPFGILTNCPDPYEPNDTQQEAYPLVFSENYDGCIAFPGDNDWFKFASGEGGIVTVRLSLDGIGSDLEYVFLYIYPVANAYTTTGEDLELTASLSADDTFYVWIYNGENPSVSTTGKYQLLVEYQALDCVDSNEPNDSISESTVIAANDTVDGCLDALTDTDWFKFSAVADDTIGITVFTESISSLLEAYSVSLYKDSSELIQQDFSDDGTNLAMVHILKYTGDYYLKIHSESSIGEYELLVNSKVENTGTMNLSFPNGGEDLLTGDSVSVEWSADASVDYVDIFYSADGGSSWTVIGSHLENSGTFLWGIPNLYESSSECLVKIYDNSFGIPFDFSDAVFTITASCPDPYEPNDTNTDAYPLVFGQQLDGCIAFPGDYDWYSFDSGEGGILTARLSLASIGSELEYVIMYVYPEVSIHTLTGEDLELSVPLVEDEKFYIWIYNGKNPVANTSGSYRLVAEYQSFECDDMNEPNDNFGQVTSISTNDTIHGCINQLTDTDHLMFYGTEADTVVINMFTEGFDIQFESYLIGLYKDSTTLIQKDISVDGKNLALVHILPESGVYILKIQSLNSVGPYKLYVNSQVQNTDDLILTFPNGGEELMTGDSIQITWNNNSSIPFVDLSYSVDGGQTWEVIHHELENNNSFTWGVPFLWESYSDCSIKIFNNSLGVPFDFSDANFTITSSCPDPNEPNDTRFNAYPLLLGNSYDGCIAFPGDNDWFKFGSSDGGKITATLSLDGIGSDLEYVFMYIYPVASAYTSTGEDLEITADLAEDDTFYVWLYNGVNPSASCTGNYRLLVEYQELNYDDINEPNDSFSDAESVEYNEAVLGAITVLEDEDYFLFTGAAGDTVFIHVLTDSIESIFSAYTVELYKDTTTLIQRVESTDGSNLILTQELLEAGAYYVKIYSNSSVGQYKLIIGTEYLVSIQEKEEFIPQHFSLKQNFPNPFNPLTTISYDLPNAEFVSLIVYNMLGQEINRLVKGMQPAGRHQVQWDASQLGSGIYFYTIEVGKFKATKKCLLLK